MISDNLANFTSSAHHKRSECRACGADRLDCILQLGPTPLAHSFLRGPREFADEISYPLDVYFCPTCSLLQLLDVIDAEVLFRQYIYVTGTSETVATHNREYASSLVECLGIEPADLVLEIASNDGSLLTCFKTLGVRTLGVEPAQNIARTAVSRGIDTIDSFFNAQTARQIARDRGPAKLVVANNVLAHVDDTKDFLRGCRDVIEEQGTVVFEVPYVRNLLQNLEYDTIYHEHLCYFSVTSLMRLCEASGLSIVRVDKTPIHGGSLRVFAKPEQRPDGHMEQVAAMAAEENALGLTDVANYRKFARSVARSREAFVEMLRNLAAKGGRIAGYGAPAKGNTLLNYCGIDTRLLPYTVDKNPLNVGLFTPGMHIPVLPVSAIDERRPEYLVILAWNFSEEIMRQQHEFRSRGGKFIIPIPDARVV